MKRRVQDWFDVWEAEPGVHVISEPRHFEEVHSYLISGTERSLLVDTGMGIADIKAVVAELTNLPVLVINSHAHWDHIGGNWRFSDVWIHADEADDLELGRPNTYLARWLTPEHFPGGVPAWLDVGSVSIPASRATRIVRGGETVDLGGRTVELVHAPGHSPGGLVFVDRAAGFMLSTDVAYAAPLYCYGPGTDPRAYRDSLVRLEAIAEGLDRMYPSHNDTPIEPEMIGRMRAGFDDVLAGRQPDSIEDGRAVHQFDGFAIMVRAELPA